MALGGVPRSLGNLGMTVVNVSSGLGDASEIHLSSSALSAVKPLSPLGSKLARGRRFGLFGNDFALESGFAPTAGAGPPKHNRRGDKDRGIGPDDYANDDREREIPQHGAAKEEQAQNRNQRDGAGKN